MTFTQLGLILNMAGAALAMYFGFPQRSHEEGVAIVLEPATPLRSGITAAQHDARVRLVRRVYVAMSHVALALMIIGALLQLVDTYRPAK